MKVTVRFFSILRERAGTARTELALREGARMEELLAAVDETLPGAFVGQMAKEGRLLVALNREYATPQAALSEGDEVALMPPVAGGVSGRRPLAAGPGRDPPSTAAAGTPRASTPAPASGPSAAAGGGPRKDGVADPGNASPHDLDPEPSTVVDLASTGLDSLEIPERDPERLLAVVLLSGGIDSPVALYEIVADGWDAVALHMDNRPFTDDMYVEKVKKHVAQVERATGRRIPLLLAPHGENQVTIARSLPERSFQCVLCKRQMYRTAEALARKLGANAIVTGESLGQVASQTLHNLQVEDDAVQFPFVRPLLGLDKEDIVKVAREIGTYDISAIPSLCCTILPERPQTHATLDKVLPLEERIGADGLLRVSTKGLKRIR